LEFFLFSIPTTNLQNLRIQLICRFEKYKVQVHVQVHVQVLVKVQMQVQVEVQVHEGTCVCVEVFDTSSRRKDAACLIDW
jgi:hypothetical protein